MFSLPLSSFLFLVLCLWLSLSLFSNSHSSSPFFYFSLMLPSCLLLFLCLSLPPLPSASPPLPSSPSLTRAPSLAPLPLFFSLSRSLSLFTTTAPRSIMTRNNKKDNGNIITSWSQPIYHHSSFRTKSWRDSTSPSNTVHAQKTKNNEIRQIFWSIFSIHTEKKSLYLHATMYWAQRRRSWCFNHAY